MPALRQPPDQRAVAPRAASILLVDDEEMLRQVGQRMLERLGYRCEVASSGAEALERLALPDAAYDLLITDLRMPGMSGYDLADRLRAEGRAIRVLVATGSSPFDDRHNALRAAGLPYLTKPWLLSDLSTAVRRALEGPPLAAPRS